MNKRTYLVAFISVALLASPVCAFASFDQNLAFGARGTAVISLQQFLIAQNLLPADSATGYFGKLTQKALITFQQNKRIVPASGFFGPLTRAQANMTPNSVSATIQNSTTPSPLPPGSDDLGGVVSAPPAGFLIPTAASVPPGFYEFLHAYRGLGYNIQYNSQDNNDRFIVTEYQETQATLSYDQLVKANASYQTKIADFTYQGMSGVVFEEMDSSNHNLVLYVHDGSRWLEISTQDHASSATHFSSNDLIAILKTFVRAQ